jgi:hypothetical protein
MHAAANALSEKNAKFICPDAEMQFATSVFNVHFKHCGNSEAEVGRQTDAIVLCEDDATFALAAVAASFAGKSRISHGRYLGAAARVRP